MVMHFSLSKNALLLNSRTVLWLVSNCDTFSAREDFVDELVKYVDVDIFGRCNGNPVDNPLDVGWAKTYEMISQCFIELDYPSSHPYTSTNSYKDCAFAHR